MEDTTRWQAIYEEADEGFNRYYLDLLETTLIQNRKSETLKEDHDNFIAALRYADQTKQGEKLREIVDLLIIYFNEQGYTEERNYWIERALQSAKADKSQEEILKFTILLASYYQETDILKCRELADEGLMLSEKLGDKESNAAAQRLWGSVHLGSEQYQKALEMLGQSAVLYAGFGDYAAVCGVAYDLGRYWSEHGDYKKSGYYLDRALNIARRYQYPRLETTILYQFGVSYFNQNNYIDAEKYIQESLKKSIENAERELYAVNMNVLGLINLKKGNYSEAKKKFAESLDLIDALHDLSNKRMVYNNLAVLAFESGDLKKSRSYREAALEISRKIEGGKDSHLIAYGLGALAIASGDFSKTRHYFKQSRDLAAERNHPFRFKASRDLQIIKIMVPLVFTVFAALSSVVFFLVLRAWLDPTPYLPLALILILVLGYIPTRHVLGYMISMGVVVSAIFVAILNIDYLYSPVFLHKFVHFPTSTWIAAGAAGFLIGMASCRYFFAWVARLGVDILYHKMDYRNKLKRYAHPSG